MPPRKALSALAALLLAAPARALLGAQHARQPVVYEDDMVAQGDDDMDVAAEDIQTDLQTDGGEVATGASEERVPQAPTGPKHKKGSDEYEELLGKKWGNVARSAEKRVRAELSRGVKEAVAKAKGEEFGKRDLAFIHVPNSYGQAVEKAALNGRREVELPMLAQPSFAATRKEEQWDAIKVAKGPGGEVWGRMYPELRGISNATGCNVYQTPQKHWPKELRDAYFTGKRPFAVLRDPYDRIVAEFRHVASGDGEPSRKEVSQRESTIERESAEYLKYYETCDVNAWIKAELPLSRDDPYRGNCHLLPQVEYFEHPSGAALALDNRLLPESFNEVMEEHGYGVQLSAQSLPQGKGCAVSAWSLDEESKELVRELYARDFELLCKTFGYCDGEELTCMQQLPGMCGGSPFERPVKKHHFNAAALAAASM